MKKSYPLSDYFFLFLSSFVFLLIVGSCNNASSGKEKNSGDTLTEAQRHLPENALRGLVVSQDLSITEMASEPMLKNPTNIDVDEKGRVWVTEAYNYRPAINGNPTNPEGDRIVILEDLNGDGKADTSKVFYQGPELNAPLGICVLGNRVIVSQSPYVWSFYDDNGDDKADRKEILFQGVGGEQHDHGIHAFLFGPDGKLYFNFGNEGKTLKDKNGKTVLDQDGDEIGPKKYRMGMVFRCDPDGSHVECLGYNFRNDYEVAVDSYGILWLSDNDDDGNRGVRINYVMDYGNYGYTDEMTGAGWRARRTNMEDSIPLQHWHLNDPGVVPNLLQTGAGSPTGMVIYEGSLLPARFHNQMIHCDAGPNVVRSYITEKTGAGYSAKIENILKGEKDQWFRPADVCVAPDGSLIIADWYDPGVGGHQAGDQQRGRIYRVAVPGSEYTIPKFDFTTAEGAVAALQNPNLSVRNHAWRALQDMGERATGPLQQLWKSGQNPRMRARAFWVLVKQSKDPSLLIKEAAADKNPDIRIVAIRAARELNNNITGLVATLVHDADPQVRRECALALHHEKGTEAARLWAMLAAQHDGKDRWYLEALGIGADRQWDSFFAAYLALVKYPLKTAAGRDIVWRARTDAAIPFLSQLASDNTVDLKSRLRYFRAYDFNPGPAKATFLLGMLDENGSVEINKLVLHHLDLNTVNHSALAQKALKEVLDSIAGTSDYLDMVRQYKVKTAGKTLLAMAIEKHDDPLGRNAAALLFSFNETRLFWQVINGSDSTRISGLLHSIGRVGNKSSLAMLQQIMLSKKYPFSLRSNAAGMIGKSGSGEDLVLELLKKKKVPASLIPPIVASVNQAWRGAVREEAASYLPQDAASKKNKLPVLKELLAYHGNAKNGGLIFKQTCAVCHQVKGEGFDFGPKLSEIGSKLPQEGLYEAIVHPSAGISFGYEGWEIRLKDGSTLSGIISSKTETDIDMKFPGGGTQHIKTTEVSAMKELGGSMMPDGLYQSLNGQQFADLLEYLGNLKKS